MSDMTEQLSMSIPVKRKRRIKAVGQDCVWQVQGPERMTTIGRVVKVIGNKVKR